MIEAFVNYRLVLCVDGTFLIGKYKCRILTAVEVDGENQVVHVVFAFVESENTQSWLWFLRKIKRLVIGDRPNVCILYDWLTGLLSAINMLQTSTTKTFFWLYLHSH